VKFFTFFFVKKFTKHPCASTNACEINFVFASYRKLSFMKLSSTLAIAAISFSAFVNPTVNRPGNETAKQSFTTEKKAQQKIQAAILLDVSNSMDGLIEQAKAQLWNMVSVMGKAKCDNAAVPQIEIALYEYGRSSNDIKAGYVKQISPFSSDLDKLSQDLFALSTNGGDEYCGQVIYTSLNDLKWDASNNSYKVIFIAGNEDFLQGNLPYTKACAEAKNKGVIVNTIYCGSRIQGINEHWNLNAECGTGSFTNINQDAKIEDIPTPYDSTLFVLNNKLNGTYISYGYGGATKFAAQAEVDQKSYSTNKSAALKRVGVKGRKDLYKNDSWDLVDAGGTGDSKEFIAKLDKKTLPDSLKNKSNDELKKIIDEKRAQRSLIQKEIEVTNNRREVYIAEARKKNATVNAPTLETEIEKIIKEQAKRYNMTIQ
jgi:hypothetical protein